MPDSLSRWKNAPLAYALAEIRTERLADIRGYQPRLAGRFRDEYPVQREMQAARLVMTGKNLLVEGDQDPAWEFATPDNRLAVVLRPTGLILHTTAYQDSRTFLAQLDRAISMFAEEVPSVFVNRLGLRYIDFILPRDGEEPEAYVDPRLNPDLGLSDAGQGVTATSLAIYRTANGELLSLRYVRARGRPELPPNLGNLSLSPSQLMTEDVQEAKPTALLDIDCNRPYAPVERLDPPKTQAQLTRMYEVVFDAFWKAITPHARTVWGAAT